MIFEQLMFDSSQQVRFNIFRLLTTLTPAHYSIDDIGQKMNLTYQQVYHHLRELNREIIEIEPEHPAILIKNHGVDSRLLSLSIDVYRYHLLKESLPFCFLQYALNVDDRSLDEFCDAYFVSRSTLTRKLKPLNHFLQSYHVKINYQMVTITGNENQVRLLYFYVLWLGTRGTVWPFSFPKEDLADYDQYFSSYFPLQSTTIGQQELEYFLAVSYARAQHGHFCSYRYRYDFIFANNPRYDLNILANDPKVGPHSKGESSYLYFLSLFAPYFSKTDDPLLDPTLEQFFRRDNPVAEFAEKFLRFCEDEFLETSLPENSRKVILANLLQVTFAFYVFDGRFPNMLSFSAESNGEIFAPAFIAATNTFLETQVNESPFLPFAKGIDEMALLYKKIVHPALLHQQERHKLKVALAIEHNHLFTQQLETFLTSLNFVTYDYFSGAADGFDLIISSSTRLKKDNPRLAFYYWDLDLEYARLMSLYQYLRQLYAEKNA